MPDGQTLETNAAAGPHRPIESGASELIHAAAVEAAYILEAVRK
jgi:hypothetical protein